ncbi:MAG: hypothetical protein FJ304_20290 [Planctomycetes bacterium]|nr:hypothetical protein [Planctomycetota bacterium]
MDEQLVALYHRHVATAFDRNVRFADFVAEKAGKAKPKYDVASATLAFGPKLKLDAPLLGSYARSNGSWLWAWANRNLNLTLTNRALGTVVKVTATRLATPALAHGGFSVEPLFGPDLAARAADVIGVIFGRELDYFAYHVIEEEGHESTVLVRDKRLKATEKKPLERVFEVFPQVLGALPVADQKAALIHYASDLGLKSVSGSGALTIVQGKRELHATFDAHNRLTKLEGPDGAAELPKAKAKTKKKA